VTKKRGGVREVPTRIGDLLPGESARILLPAAYRYVVRTGSLGQAVLGRLREPIVFDPDVEIDRWGGPNAVSQEPGDNVDPLTGRRK